MKAIWIDVESDEVKVIDTKADLKAMYAMCNCDCIDIAVRSIGGKPYNIVVDDEGLLKSNWTIGALNHDNELMLAGNLVVLGINRRTCDFAGLTDADVENIMGYVREVIDFAAGSMHPVLECEYC